MQTRAFLVLALLLTTSLACRSTGEREGGTVTPPTVVEPAQCGDIARLSRFGDIWVASQPSGRDFALAQDAGVVSVLDMRRPSETRGFDEAGLAADFGLEYRVTPIAGPSELTDEAIDAARAALVEMPRPILVHCGTANRAAAVWIAYRALDEGAGLDDAVLEARAMGLRSPVYETRMRAYVEARR